VEIYSTAGQVTDGNMIHAYCIMDTEDYRNTLRIRNTYCYFAAKTVSRTRFNVTLYLFCLFFYYCRSVLATDANMIVRKYVGSNIREKLEEGKQDYGNISL
jgi:hypothetical protein